MKKRNYHRPKIKNAISDIYRDFKKQYGEKEAIEKIIKITNTITKDEVNENGTFH